MKTSDFSFELPEHLIAQYPALERGQSRLMTLNRLSGEKNHSTISRLPEILCSEKFLSTSGEKPLLVFNDTKVRKARLTGKSLETDAKAEFLLLENNNGEWKTIVQRASRRKAGSGYVFYDKNNKEIARAQITKEEGEFRFLKFDSPIDDEWLNQYGSVPLPPYIKRNDNPDDVRSDDAERYQTVYAKETGSAAAPTAGLHFTDEILKTLSEKGIETAFVTLHVGLGTFLPVRCENIKDHRMHEEQYFINEKTALQIEQAKSNGRKIIAVGTTSLRTLESAWNNGNIKNRSGNTSIFIYPGYNFKIIDALFTNFHTPESTLIMLVSAFAGKELIMESYNEAINEGYKFFSYGDAMLIH